MKPLSTIAIFYFCITALSAVAQSESHITGLAGAWIKSRGFFFDSTITFYRAPQEYAETYVFTPDHKIKWSRRKYEELRCTMGENSLEDGKWKLKGDNLTLRLRGKIVGQGRYSWEIMYKIEELSYPDLKLRLIKVIENKTQPED